MAAGSDRDRRLSNETRPDDVPHSTDGRVDDPEAIGRESHVISEPKAGRQNIQQDSSSPRSVPHAHSEFLDLALAGLTGWDLVLHR